MTIWVGIWMWVLRFDFATDLNYIFQFNKYCASFEMQNAAFRQFYTPKILYYACKQFPALIFHVIFLLLAYNGLYSREN